MNSSTCSPAQSVAADEAQRTDMPLARGEIAAIAHALREAHNAIRINEGDQYGTLTLGELEALARRFETELSLLSR